jgi:Divergent InlB B-repeat domain/Concanavalin A-like lectin/glucanases superfamily
MRQGHVFVVFAVSALLFGGACGSVSTSGDANVPADGLAGAAGTAGAGTAGAGTAGVGAAGAGGAIDAGADAAAGASGVAGTSGTAGLNGAAGATGAAGINGAAGTSGAAGINGAAGTSGTAGTHGAAGATGAAGAGGPFLLSITRAGAGTGTVASTPVGISCGATCSASFAASTMVTLTATPAAGSSFTSWSGACTGPGACVVSVTAATSVVATFGLNRLALSVAPAGTGAGTVTSNPTGITCGGTCSSSYDYGTSVTLTATPATGSSFAGWSAGGCTGTGTCVVSVTAATNVVPTFTLNQYALTVTPAGTGAGTVTSSPAGIACGSTCMANFTYDTSVTLTATPAAGSTFGGWTGSGCSGTGTCVVAVTAAAGVTATFTAIGPVPILHYALDSTGANTGSVANYPLTLNGTVSYVAGRFGQAAQFAAGAYGVVSGSARAVLGTEPAYTISFWINASASLNTSNGFLDFENRFTAPYGGIQLYYVSATQLGICVATTSSPYLTGSCALFAPPAAGAWHNIILRYAGTGTGAGQGGNVEVYEDDVLVETVLNDASNNPVFNQSIADTLYIGAGGMTLDDVRVYDSALTPANQCTQIIGGTWAGGACTLP